MTKPINERETEKSEGLLHEALATNGAARIVLISPSMDPLLPVGAEADVEPCNFDELKRFDLILFRQEKKVICHAVWGRSSLKNARGETTLLTWGLANPGADDPVEARDVLARVVSHRLTSFQVAWAISVRLFSQFVGSTFFVLVTLLLAVYLRFSDLKATPGATVDPSSVFAICSTLAVYVFTQLRARGTKVRGRLMALALALSPLAISVAHDSAPWVAVEAMAVFYIVAIWNFFQGERARLRNLLVITVIIAVVLKLEPTHFAWRLRSPLGWHFSEWKIMLNPVAIFAGVTLAAWLYRLVFRLSIRAPDRATA